MSQVVEDAKAEYNRAKNRITNGIKATPADKVNWSPSPTARTPIQLVAHAAMGTKGIGGMLKGEPMPFADIAAMDAAMRKSEAEFTTVDAALGFLESTSAQYIAWLDSLTDEQVASTVKLPFGEQPMAAAITFPADHLRGHAAQLDYIQTIYGDYEWRF